MDNSRFFSVGDVHGCLRALRTLLGQLALTPSDTVIFLGDYIDRGEDSAGVLRCVADLAKQCHVRCVMGNHEEFLLRAARDKDAVSAYMWLGNGGRKTLHSMGLSMDINGAFAVSADIVGQVEVMEDFVEYPQWLFTHASIEPRKPMHEQTGDDLRWRRSSRGEVHQHISGKVTVCGHTPQVSGDPLAERGYICIDTYAFGGGWLTALEMNSLEYVQANEAGNTREGRIDAALVYGA